MPRPPATALRLAPDRPGKFGEQFQNFATLRIAEAVQRIIPWVERLGPRAVGQHHLVPGAEEMDIGDAKRLHRPDQAAVDDVLGGDEHLVLLVVEHGAVVGDEEAVVRADLHVAFGQTVAETALRDQDGPKVRGHGKLPVVERPLAGPADFLNAVVARDDAIADGKLLDGAFTPEGGNGGSGCKAGHDTLYVFN